MAEVSPGQPRHGRPARWWPALPWPTLRRPTRQADGVVWQVVGAIVVGVVAIVIAGWSPGVIGVWAGVLTWLLLAAWRALVRRRSK